MPEYLTLLYIIKVSIGYGTKEDYDGANQGGDHGALILNYPAGAQ